MNIGSLEILNALLCEDVRREDNGKEFLIGVFSGNIGVGEYPAKINTCVWMQTRVRESGLRKFAFRLVGDDGATYFSVAHEAEMNADDGGWGTMIFGGIQMQIMKDTNLCLEGKIDDSDWQIIQEFVVQKRPPE